MSVVPSVIVADVAPSVRRDVVTSADSNTTKLPGSGVVTIAGGTAMTATLPAPVAGARLDIISTTGGAVHTVNANSTATSFTSTGANQLSFAAAARVAVSLIGISDSAWRILSTVASATGGTVTVAKKST